MEEKILFVDDDENLLASMRRSLQKYFNVETRWARAGIAIIKDAFAVVFPIFACRHGWRSISIESQEIAPNTVRMMLTGYATSTRR